MHLALIGYGSIAQGVLAALPDHVTRITLLVRDTARVPATVNANVVTTTEGLVAAQPDLVIECAGHSAVASYAPCLLYSGIDTVIASVGALADDTLLEKLNHNAHDSGARLILPSGAIGGLDILRALSQAGDVDVTYRGIKPPSAWKGSPAEDAIDLGAITEPTTFFTGTARKAALAYPKNANVVAALALAGGGFDRMQVNLIADPAATGNQHSYAVTSPHGHYDMTLHAAPTSGNARTSYTTILSLLAEVAAHR